MVDKVNVLYFATVNATLILNRSNYNVDLTKVLH